jgi:Ca2+-binding RTX toxin-like protein
LLAYKAFRRGGARIAIEGTPESDALYGTTGSDTLIGRGGNDGLYGNAGDDTYLFSAFDGRDYLSDSAGIDRIVFDASVSRGHIRLVTSDYGDLLIENEDTGDELRLDGQFDGGSYRIERIAFADGNLIDLTAPLTFTGDPEGNSIYATSGNDTLIGKGGNDRLHDDAGGDTYVFSAYDGADYISDAGGPDGIRFQAGVSFADLTFNNDGYNNLIIRNSSTADNLGFAKAVPPRRAGSSWLWPDLITSGLRP